MCQSYPLIIAVINACYIVELNKFCLASWETINRFDIGIYYILS